MHKEGATEFWAPQDLSVDVRERQEVWEVGDPGRKAPRGPQSPEAQGFTPSDPRGQAGEPRLVPPAEAGPCL